MGRGVSVKLQNGGFAHRKHLMIGWFNAKEAEAFGTSLAKFFIEKLPPDNSFNESKLSSKTEYVLTKMTAKVKAFKQDAQLNIYKTAKLGNAFRWTLKDAGYPEPYIETLVSWLVTNLR